MDTGNPGTNVKKNIDKMKKVKVLWVTNQIFPEVAESLNLYKTNTGGWVYGLANNLKKKNELELHIATAYKTDDPIRMLLDKIEFHILPSDTANTAYNKKLELSWQKLITKIKPDVVHIHGTEFAHGLALMNACPGEKYVISIQGLVSVCVKYYLADLSFTDILKNITLRDILRQDNIWQGKKQYRKRGVLEKKYIEKTKHVMGRTEWDYTNSKVINPNVNYHFCNETLRAPFYNNKKWDFKKINKFTIFLSQGAHPIKGLHKVLEALYLIKKNFKNVSLNIAGGNLISDTTYKDRLKLNGYGKIIKKSIQNYNLEENIRFLGMLDENEMKTEYLNSHVFICPSSIENSPNSLGEAQITGTPSIASFVGGNHNLITHGTDGFLYRFEASEMLAHFVLKIFNNPAIAQRLSVNGIITAEKRHNETTNANRTFEIYKDISTGKF